MTTLKITASLENYIETIYHLVEDNQVARAIDISKKMGVGKASVTEALKSLAKRKLINYAPYSDVTLTAVGEKVAIEVAAAAAASSAASSSGATGVSVMSRASASGASS